MQKNSLRWKLFVPFGLTVIFLLTVLLALLIQVITQSMREQVKTQLEKQHAVIAQGIETRLKDLVLYARMAADMKQYLDTQAPSQMISIKRVPVDLFEKEGLTLYWDVSSLTPEQMVRYQRLIADGYLGEDRRGVYLYEENGQSVLSICAVAASMMNGKPHPVIVEMIIDDAVLNRISGWQDYYTGLICEKKQNGKMTSIQLVANTLPMSFQESLLKTVARFFEKKAITSKEGVTDTFKLMGNRYQAKLTPFRFQSDVYLFSMCSYEAVWLAYVRVCIAVLILFAVIMVWLFFIYMMVIRQMTYSLDLIYQTMKRVDEGHFDVALSIETKDEIEQIALGLQAMLKRLKSGYQELKHRKTQLERLFMQFPEAVIVTDQENKVILMNPRAEAYFKAGNVKEARKNLANQLKDTDLFGFVRDAKQHGVYEPVYQFEMTGKLGKKQTYSFVSLLLESDSDDVLGVVSLIKEIQSARGRKKTADATEKPKRAARKTTLA